MALRIPSLETFRIFDACARHMNFSHAAKELCITPAAVSQRIRTLETEIGKPLFIRHGPRIRLNGDGETLFRHTRAIMTRARAAIEELQAVRTLRLTATPTFASRWLAVHLAEFEAAHPGIAIEIDVSADIRLPGQYDLAIRSGDGNWADVRATRLFPIDVTPMLSPRLTDDTDTQHPVDLARLPMIPSADWTRWFAGQGCPAAAMPADGRKAYPSQDLAARAALEGKGVALLSPRLFAGELAARRLVQPFAFVLSGPDHYWLVEPAGARGSAADAFRMWLLDRIRAG